MAVNKTMSYRWVIFCCLMAAYVLMFFHRMSIGTLKDDLMNILAMSSTTFATLGAMYFYAYLIMQVPTGILADTLGSRITVAAGSLVAAIGTIIFALSHSILNLCVGRFLVGLGVSVVFVCILKIISQWFKESEFATMLGLAGLIGNMGSILAGAPLAFWVITFSLKSTFIFIGLLSLLMAIICFLLIRNKPEDMGYPSIAEIEGRVETTQGNDTVSVKEGFLGVVRNRKTWLLFTIIVCYFSPFFTFAGTWGVSYIRNIYGMDNVQAARYITLVTLGMALGYLLIGFISDRMKSRKIPLLFFGILINISWLVMLFYNGAHLTPRLLETIMFLIGASSACFSLTFSLCKEVNNPKYFGMAASIVNMGAFAGGATVPILVGNILDKYNGILTGADLFRRGFLICLILNGIGLAVSFLVKETGCKNVYFDSKIKAAD
jgi:sugar phosphate permease